MKKTRLIVALTIIAMVSCVSIVARVYAQNADTDTSTDAESPILTVKQTVSTLANVEVNINGQTYVVNVPVTVDIDAQAALEDASLKTDNNSKVGLLSWKLGDIHEVADEYIHDRYSSIEVSSDENKLIVVTSDVTNFDNETHDLDWSSFADVLGFDELGNTYEVEARYCGEADPGETVSCTVVFDVPQNVVISGVEVQVIDKKRLTLQ
ncbi:MAG: hypothetical protein KDE47_24185 [Caldilineaceae bacterium]|nr:hypothetical protein [Caldilineaceae bacterium]MCB9147914.1 hypothetical protein [Caldilineaceae bacterium]